MELRAEHPLIGRAGFLLSESWPGNELAWLLARDAMGAGELISRVREENVRSTKLTAMLGAVKGRAMDFLGGQAPSSCTRPRCAVPRGLETPVACAQMAV